MTPEASHIEVPNGRSYVQNKVDNGFFFYSFLRFSFRTVQEHSSGIGTRQLQHLTSILDSSNTVILLANTSGCTTMSAYTELSVTVNVKQSIKSSVVTSFLHYVPTLLKHLSVSEMRYEVSLISLHTVMFSCGLTDLYCDCCGLMK